MGLLMPTTLVGVPEEGGRITIRDPKVKVARALTAPLAA